MKIDFSQILKNIDGTDLAGAEGPMTLASVVQSALLTVQEEDRNVRIDPKASGDAKVKLYKLAMAIEPAPMEFPVEDLALMKRRVAPMYGPLVVGQVWQMLDGTD